MKLDVGFELNYWDGPIEFFGTLDGKLIYAVVFDDDVHKDDRRFSYWHLTGASGAAALARALLRPASGVFRSSEVEWAA